jgi:hypothetical protein
LHNANFQLTDVNQPVSKSNLIQGPGSRQVSNRKDRRRQWIYDALIGYADWQGWRASAMSCGRSNVSENRPELDRCAAATPSSPIPSAGGPSSRASGRRGRERIASCRPTPRRRFARAGSELNAHLSS